MIKHLEMDVLQIVQLNQLGLVMDKCQCQFVKNVGMEFLKVLKPVMTQIWFQLMGVQDVFSNQDSTVLVSLVLVVQFVETVYWKDMKIVKTMIHLEEMDVLQTVQLK